MCVLVLYELVLRAHAVTYVTLCFHDATSNYTHTSFNAKEELMWSKEQGEGHASVIGEYLIGNSFYLAISMCALCSCTVLRVRYGNSFALVTFEFIREM